MGLVHANVCTEFDAKMAANQRPLIEPPLSPCRRGIRAGLDDPSHALTEPVADILQPRPAIFNAIMQERREEGPWLMARKPLNRSYRPLSDRGGSDQGCCGRVLATLGSAR